MELELFQHVPFFDPAHPDYARYKDEFRTVDYNKPRYRQQYYETFFGAATSDDRRQVCIDYLRSLVFCFRYYTEGVPSWGYHYPHRMAPLPGDLVRTLREGGDFLRGAGAGGGAGGGGNGGGGNGGGGPALDFDFELGEPLRPLELQMVVLPPSTEVLPGHMTDLMKEPSPLARFYPEEFELDVLRGEKFIYSDPLLPELSIEDVDEIKGAMYEAGLGEDDFGALAARNIREEDVHGGGGGGGGLEAAAATSNGP